MKKTHPPAGADLPRIAHAHDADAGDVPAGMPRLLAGIALVCRRAWRRVRAALGGQGIIWRSWATRPPAVAKLRGCPSISGLCLLYDVFARTSGGVSFLFLDLLDVRWTALKRINKALGNPSKPPRGAEAAQRVQLRTCETAMQCLLCGFAKHPLAPLAEEARLTVLQSFGLRGRAGLSIAGLLARLAAELDPDEYLSLAPPDWEAAAARIAGECVREADPRLREAWERLRRLTASFAPLKGTSLFLAALPAGSGGQLLPGAPEDDCDERLGWIMERAWEAQRLMDSIARLRKPFADALRRAVEAELHAMLDRIAGVLPARLEDPSFVKGHVAWHLAEAEADCTAYMSDFDRRFKASRHSFAVYDIYSFRLRFLLKRDDGLYFSRPFKAELERALRHVERFRVEPEPWRTADAADDAAPAAPGGSGRQAASRRKKPRTGLTEGP